MNKTKMIIMITAAIFLFVSLGYCQELSDRELKIFYDAAWQLIRAEYLFSRDPNVADEEYEQNVMQQLLSQNGITLEQLEDIIDRGNNMPFTATEEQISKELKAKITDNLTADEFFATLNDLANKYGISVGQVSTVFSRNILRDYEEE